MTIPRLVITGSTSSVGKTSITSAIIYGLKKRGYSVQPFKVGPDHIDPSYLSSISNNETKNPLWHGEIHTLKKFYEVDKKKRPDEKNCIFLSSHEPCSLCLSAITFAGFDNFYYLFPYESTSEEFKIPHDLNILKEVFNVTDGKYIKETFNYLSANKKGKVFRNLKDAYEHFGNILHNNDLLMVKGSNATGLNQFSKNIKRGQVSAI